MQLLLLLSALLTGLTGVVTGRVAAPQQLVAATTQVEAIRAEPAGIAIVVLGAIFAVALRVLPLPRPFKLYRTVAIYRARRRE